MVALFKRYLQSKGKSATKPRERIAAAAFAAGGHFSVVDLWQRLQLERVSLATIYRTMELLEEAGLIRKISLGGDLAHYEPLLGRRPHGHLVCTSCHQLIEFSDSVIEERLAEAAERYGFQQRSFQVQAFGLCPNCQKEQSQV